MKLIIQIPCYNEEETLPIVLREIPHSIAGIDIIELQIVDDGSEDNTVAVAQRMGVHHIIQHIGNKGLGNAFRNGAEHALSIDADILVNTDGDNQYPSRFIPALIQPILDGKADIVVGNRQTSQIKHFSPLKRFLQWLGTKFTILLSGEREVEDAVSGFRAYSKAALLELNVTSGFSYVLDTTVQASQKRLKMVSIPIETNPPTRPSRLFSTIWEHVYKSGTQVIRIYAMYRPLRVFIGLGFILLIIGLIPIMRFLHDYFFVNGGEGMVQSLIIGSIVVSVSVNCFALGVIGDLLGKNRTLIEQLLKEQKKQKLETRPHEYTDAHE